MKVFIEKENRTVDLEGPFSSAEQALLAVKVNPNTVLIVRSGEVILPQEPVSDSDELTLLSVVSGG